MPKHPSWSTPLYENYFSRGNGYAPTGPGRSNGVDFFPEKKIELRLGYGNDSDYTQPATLGLVTAYEALPQIIAQLWQLIFILSKFDQ